MRLSFLNSPVTQAELAYQRRFRLPMRRLIKPVIWLALTVSMIFFWGEFVGAITARDARPIIQALTIPMIFLVITAVVVHFGVIIQTLMLAYNCIAREKRGGTWESLILTAMQERQIILSKWWATVRRMRGSFLLAALLAVGPMVVLQAETIRFFAISPFRPVDINKYLINWFSIILGGVVILILSQIAVVFAAAIGIITPFITYRRGFGFALAIILYIVTVIIFAFALYMTPGFLHNLFPLLQPDKSFRFVFDAAAITLIDGGSLFGSSLVSSATPQYFDMSIPVVLITFMISLAAYLILTLLALRLAQSLAVRQGALPPQRSKNHPVGAT